MTKFQKIQFFISFIPYISAPIIFVITAIELKRKKASILYWFSLFGISFLMSLISLIVIDNLLSDSILFLRIIVNTGIFAVGNLFLIEIQDRVTQKYQEAKEAEIGDMTNDSTPKSVIKNNKTKIKVCAAIAILLIGLVAVGGRFIYLYKTGIIEDVNGPDNYLLATITDKQIAETEYDDCFTFAVASYKQGNSTQVEDKWHKDADRDTVHEKVGSFNGIKIVNATKTDAEKISFKINSKVKSGNFIVKVYVENEFFCDVVPNTDKEFVIEGVSGKTVYIKAAGEDAKIELDIQRTILERKTGDG